MKKIILLNKKEGETPLLSLENFRSKNKKYKEVKMTYAGRLDPMAKGLLLVLAGEEIKNKEKYLNMEKEYEFQILFGFATDTYDILGEVISFAPEVPFLLGSELRKKIKENLKYLKGNFIQKYPIYSSKTVKGKPLFSYARGGESVEIPERNIFVKNLNLVKIFKISNKKLLQNIEKRISKINGDFRQKEILKIWRKELDNKHSSPSNYFIGEFKIKCSSGTYVRGIANSLGEMIGIPALAFFINRKRIGKFSLGE